MLEAFLDDSECRFVANLRDEPRGIEEYGSSFNIRAAVVAGAIAA